MLYKCNKHHNSKITSGKYECCQKWMTGQSMATREKPQNKQTHTPACSFFLHSVCVRSPFPQFPLIFKELNSICEEIGFTELGVFVKLVELQTIRHDGNGGEIVRHLSGH